MKPTQEQPQHSDRKSRSTGVVVPNTPRWYQQMAAWLIFALLRGLASTLRYQWNDRSGFFQGATEPVIFCVWHNRLAISLIVYRDFICRGGRNPKLAAIVSASKDGGIVARILEHFNVQPVRGSSSRRGPQALLELTSWAERGYDLAITPDGPRGPRYVVQPGVISLAQLTGLPIVPVTYHFRWKIAMRSWDRFQIPLPFSSGVLKLGAPIEVPRDASEEHRESIRQRVESCLRELTVD